MIIAGIDEAGYGPLLGPLVVSAAAFAVPEQLDLANPASAPCLWQRLKPAVAAKGPVRDGRVLIADSKAVTHLANGVALLEQAALACLGIRQPLLPDAAAAGSPAEIAAVPANTLGLLNSLDSPTQGVLAHPWYAADTAALPRFCSPDATALAANLLRNVLGATHTSLLHLSSRVAAEGEYNRMVQATNNKASALLSLTLGRLDALHRQFVGEGLLVIVDKQGGRGHYLQPLMAVFPDSQVRVLDESPTCSGYLLTSPAGRMAVYFQEKAEKHCLATALASMVCKYIRELMMHAFNGWWRRHRPDIEPTAGYYQDAMRWLAEMEPTIATLGIARDQLVRCR